MKIIEAKNISKSFNDNPVLSKVSFAIEKGTFTALLGKNGSGKSTILNILMGEILLDKGDCLLFGRDLKSNPDDLKNKIAHVSEKIFFAYPMAISKFIPEYAKFFTSFDTKLFFQMAEDVKLDLGRTFGTYSRGQKMQILLMAALAQGAELLLVDEVTSVLDAFSRNYFIARLKEFTAKGGTVILTTNIVSEVQNFCTDVLFLSQNQIKFQTPLKSVGENFKKVRSLDGKHPLLKNQQCFLSGTNSDGSFSYIFPQNKVNEKDFPDLMQDKRGVTLEDLYIYHSQREHND
jgi:ABC-2 type transport system ATP-binding protein